MNIAIRIAQVILAYYAISGVYGVALQLFLAPLAQNPPDVIDVIGTVASVLIAGLLVFLLQRYYEIRNQGTVRTDAKAFTGLALTGSAIVAMVGIGLVTLIFIGAFLSL